ncbi:MAG TPA: hypothetical protein VK869_03345 [Rubrobacteraceae bacterium]|nr:hypothetical protein [Rubrobacteraceae bacterium]
MILLRSSGLAAALGGALWILRAVLDGRRAPETGGLADAAFFIVPLLLLAGLGGLYVLYGDRLAGLGHAGFSQGFIGLGMLAVGLFGEFTLGFEGAGRLSSLGFLVLALGMVLLGYGSFSKEPFPRFNSLPLVIGIAVPLDLLVGEIPWARIAVSALFGIGWVLLGYLIWQARPPDEERS